MAWKTLDDMELSGKVVLTRVDINVPVEAGKVTDATRIERIAPTVKDILAKGGKPVLLAHFGRPKGKVVPEMSLRMTLPALEKVLGVPVAFAEDCVGDVAEKAIADLPSGSVLLLENTRFHAEEEKNDPAFAKAMAAQTPLRTRRARECRSPASSSKTTAGTTNRTVASLVHTAARSATAPRRRWERYSDHNTPTDIPTAAASTSAFPVYQNTGKEITQTATATTTEVRLWVRYRTSDASRNVAPTSASTLTTNNDTAASAGTHPATHGASARWENGRTTRSGASLVKCSTRRRYWVWSMIRPLRTSPSAVTYHG